MCYQPISIPGKGLLPCGKCFECVKKHSDEWTARCVLESTLYEKNCMVTLTYNEDFLPETGKLERSDYQKFLKRLRKKFPEITIRYYGCGEYGSLHGRPHFHIVLFNFDFSDKYFYKKDKKGVRLFRSDTLEKLWTFGFSSIGEVNAHTIKYCTKYLQKCFFDKDMKGFTFMSKMQGGIGLKAFEKSSVPIISDKVYYDGRYIRIPEYFLRKKKEQGFELEYDYVKECRKKNSRSEFVKNSLRYIDEDGVIEDYLTYDEKLYKKALEIRRKKIEKLFGKYLTY